jgi:hypothetical protein
MNDIDFETRRAMNIYDDDEPHALVKCGQCALPYLYSGEACLCPNCGTHDPTDPEPIDTLMEILPNGRFVPFNPFKR